MSEPCARCGGTVQDDDSLGMCPACFGEYRGELSGDQSEPMPEQANPYEH